MTPRTRTLLVLIAAVVVAGCGGAGPTVREPTGAFTVTLDDYTIRPQQIRVPKSTPLTVTVTNRGRLGHTLRIRSTNHVVLTFTTVKPGASKRRTFNPAPGRYTMFCALSNHEELGMHGTLVVG